ncbi:hypothetical protein BLOT_003274 [Blomia tropicalis]|nr:hypothetical protein BLOT_003274 [Blomia tropicalis]
MLHVVDSPAEARQCPTPSSTGAATLPQHCERTNSIRERARRSSILVQVGSTAPIGSIRHERAVVVPVPWKPHQSRHSPTLLVVLEDPAGPVNT